MRLLKLLLAGAAVGVIVIAFRDSEQGGWRSVPLLSRGEDQGGEATEAEPVLGYDGMDVDGVIEWMEQAGPDRATLTRMRAYEAANLAREAVLIAIDERI
jgi:hypothetical protein